MKFELVSNFYHCGGIMMTKEPPMIMKISSGVLLSVSV
jgi:hypothetical protein